MDLLLLLLLMALVAFCSIGGAVFLYFALVLYEWVKGRPIGDWHYWA